MNYLQKIKQAIDARLEWKECNAFYIGKTSDFEERKIEHENDHYNLCWELAHGIPEQISELENALICTYKGNSKLFNKNEGSGGNPEATILYVAFQFKDLGLDDLHDDIVPISDGFPIEIK